MRNPNRIYSVTNKLTALWSLFPDLRFGQLFSFIVDYGHTHYGVNDTFYVEDDGWEKILTEMIEEYTPN